MVGQHRGIRSLIPKEVTYPTEFSRWVRLQPFTHIKNAYHTSCCLISSRIHGCRIRFNRNRRHYESFRFVHASHVTVLVVLLLSFSPPRCLSKPLSSISSPRAPGPSFISSWSPPVVCACTSELSEIGLHERWASDISSGAMFDFLGRLTDILCAVEFHVVYNWHYIIIGAQTGLRGQNFWWPPFFFFEPPAATNQPGSGPAFWFRNPLATTICGVWEAASPHLWFHLRRRVGGSPKFVAVDIEVSFIIPCSVYNTSSRYREQECVQHHINFHLRATSNGATYTVVIFLAVLLTHSG